MKRVIFVDDDANLLEGIKLSLRQLRDEWTMAFATSGLQALDIMAAEDEPFDVIVTDMLMPGMGGKNLLQSIMNVYPQMVRIVLSGHLEAENVIDAAAYAHQILRKPCEPVVLRERITRAFALNHHLPDCPMKEALFAMCGIPSVPTVYWNLWNEINSASPSITAIAGIIETDPSMSAKVLQVAHAAYRGAHKFSSISEAVNLIGLANIRGMVLMPGIFEVADPSLLPASIDLEVLWKHALQVADFAKRISDREHEDKVQNDEAYSAGLLHDIGLLIVATKMPTEFSRAVELRMNKHESLMEAEKEVFGATHAEMGGFLLDLWGLPDHVVEAITFHLYPSSTPDHTYRSLLLDTTEGVTALTAVHVANYLSEDQDSLIEDRAKAKVDHIHLADIGMSDKLGGWWDLCFSR